MMCQALLLLSSPVAPRPARGGGRSVHPCPPRPAGFGSQFSNCDQPENFQH
jgi:hypothetical protein